MMTTRRDHTDSMAAGIGHYAQLAVARWALIGAAVCLLMFGPRLALADCCTCTAPFGNGNFCAPDPSDGVQCGQSYNGGQPDCTVNAVIVGGTCSGGNDPGGTGLDGTCVAPTKAPAPTLSPFALIGLFAALAGAGFTIAKRRTIRPLS
jgi:hypothetical protein